MSLYDAISRVLRCCVTLDRDIAHLYGADKRLSHVLPSAARGTAGLLECAREDLAEEVMRAKREGGVWVSRADVAAMLEVYEDRNTMELNAGGIGMGDDLQRAARVRELLK